MNKLFPRVSLVLLALILSIITIVQPFSAGAADELPGGNMELQGSGQDSPSSPDIKAWYSKDINPKLDLTLNRLVNGQTAALSPFAEIEKSPDGADLVRVVMESVAGKEDEAAEASSKVGELEAEYNGLYQLNVPASELTSLAADESVSFIRLPYYAVTYDDVTSEGVALINANTWQSTGFDGSGVKIGIIDLGFENYEDLQGGELPVNITTSWGPGGMGTGDHGTACAEIIYEIAPEAQYYLAYCSTDVQFGPAVDWLIAQDVDIISSSIGWSWMAPGVSKDNIYTKISQVAGAGILWAQAAGNEAQQHWSGNYLDSGHDGLHIFFGTDELNGISANSGSTIRIVLTWNDPWGASRNDYNLYLINSSGQTLDFSEIPQNGSGCYPIEEIVYQANYNGIYYIAIAGYDDPDIKKLHLYSYNHVLEYPVAAGSLCIPADSVDVLTVGAVPHSSPATIEYFSSQGPTTDGRVKPDIVAPDGVSNFTYGNFYGTSAAAPCAAGAAALVKEAYPGFSNEEIQGYLEANAVPLSATGKNNIFGSGRLFLGTPPSKIVFITEPQTIIAGEVSAMIVQLQNSAGVPLRAVSAIDINLSSSSSNGRFDIEEDGLFDGTVTKVTVEPGENFATFYYTDTKAGTPTITASRSGMTSATQQETINAGPAASLAIAVAPGKGASVDVPLATQPVIRVRDQYNNLKSGAEVIVSVAPEKGSAEALRGDLTAISGADGLAAFTNLGYNKSGEAFTLRFTVGDITVDSSSLGPLAAGAAAKISLFTPPVIGASVDAVLATQPVVLVQDQYDNPRSGTQVTVSTGTGTAAALRGTLKATSAADGKATFTNLGYNKSREEFTLSFTAEALTTESDPLGPLSAGTEKSMTISIQPATGVGDTVDNALSTQPVILVMDQYSNPVSGGEVTASVATGTGTLRENSMDTDAEGLAGFTGLGYSKSGETFKIKFTCGSLSQTSNELGPLSHGIPTIIRVETAPNGLGVVVPSQNLLSGVSDPLEVYGIARDQYGNFAGNQSETTWSLTGDTGSVTFTPEPGVQSFTASLTANDPGAVVIHAANGSLDPVSSGTIYITNHAPNQIMIVTPPEVGTTVDDEFTVQLQVSYQPVNPEDPEDVEEFVGGIPVTVSIGEKGTASALRGTKTVIAGDGGLATFADLGYSKSGEEFTLHFAAGDLTADSDPLTPLGPLDPGVIDQLNVETKGDGTGSIVLKRSITTGSSLTAYAITRDQYANYINNIPVNWSLINRTSGVVESDLAAAPDSRSAVFTGNQTGTAIIHIEDEDTSLEGDSGVITVSRPSSSEGGGGGGGGGSTTSVTLKGWTAKGDLKLGSSGLRANAVLTSTDGKVTLEVKKGTKMMKDARAVVTTLTLEPLSDPPVPPPDHAVVLAYDLGPDGATFNPALTLGFTYDPDDLPEGVAEEDLYLAFWNGTDWETLKSTLDAEDHKFTASITHFSTYAVLGKSTLPPTPAIKETPTPTSSTEPAAPTPTKEPTPAANAASPEPQKVSPLAGDPEPAPFNWPLIAGVCIAIAALAGVVFIIKRRRAASG